MTSPASLRDLYNNPNSSWAFTPMSNGSLQSGASSAVPSGSSTGASWSTHQTNTHHYHFDLSPSLETGSGASPKMLLKALIASAFLQYTTTAIAMPWEVGKVMLQVQWIPKDVDADEVEVGLDDTEQYADQETMSESSSDDSYFHDPASASHSRRTQRRTRPSGASTATAQPRQRRPSEGTRLPSYMIPVGPPDGVFGMMRRIGGFKSEGWLSLWKGIITSCVNEVLSSTLQPMVLNFLRPINPTGSLLAPIASHMITGFLLSPLDLLRTRQIVYPRKDSPSAFTLLSQIIHDEGGIRAVYLDSRFLIPTLLDHSIRPLITLALPGLIHRQLGLRDSMNPLTYPLAEFLGACGGLLITLPIETIRRRLQVQSRSGHSSKSCVQLRPKPYIGVLDTLWRVLSEERSAPRKRRRRNWRGKAREVQPADVPEDEGFLISTGVGQLFRGFGMGVGALALVLVLALTTGGEDEGWAEL